MKLVTIVSCYDLKYSLWEWILLRLCSSAQAVIHYILRKIKNNGGWTLKLKIKKTDR